MEAVLFVSERATAGIYPFSLRDARPIASGDSAGDSAGGGGGGGASGTSTRASTSVGSSGVSGPRGATAVAAGGGWEEYSAGSAGAVASAGRRRS